MVQLLIILALSIALIAVLGRWRRDRRLLFDLRKGSEDGDPERTVALEKANENLKASQADLQRRWQYLAEAQRLSHSGTFGWKVQSGELVWSDETHKILSFARETNPTLDLVFDRVQPWIRNLFCRADFAVPEALHYVIVHHAYGLHEGVADG